MVAERRSMKNWAARLSADDETLTLEEARTLAAIAQADRALESRDIQKDIQARLMVLDMFLEERMPGYAEWRRERLKRQLTEAAS